MSTNPNNAVGTNAAYGGRTSVNARNDILSAWNGRGIISGWSVAPSSGMTVEVGGVSGVRDVAIVEDASDNKTTVNNISGSPISVTLEAAPTTNSRIDAIVIYVDNPPQGEPMVIDNPQPCGIIAVTGTPDSTPTAPDDSAIRAAITADGAAGVNAYYVVIANITVGSGVTDITGDVIEAGVIASINNDSFTTLNSGALNNNVNSDQYYNQYEFIVPQDGRYFIAFWQRLLAADSGRDFYLRITQNGNVVNSAVTGGTTYIAFIQGVVMAGVSAKKGDVIRCMSSGGGSGVKQTGNGHVTIMRLS